MPRARQIKPTFFMHETVSLLSFFTRLYWIGLWTLADRDGRLEYRPMRIKAQLFPYEAVDIDASTLELESKGFVQRAKIKDGRVVLYITNWKKHQKPHQNETASEFPPLDEALEPLDEALSLEPRTLNLEPVTLNTDSTAPSQVPKATDEVVQKPPREKTPSRPKGRNYNIAALEIKDEVMTQAERVWSGWPKDGWNFSTKKPAPRRINRALFLERFQEILTHSPIRKADDSRISAEDLANSALEFVRVRIAEGRREGSEIPNVPCVANFFSSCENEKNPWKDALLAYFGG